MTLRFVFESDVFIPANITEVRGKDSDMNFNLDGFEKFISKDLK